MLDRSRASRALSAAIAVACLLTIPTAAGAASPPDVQTRPVPADAPLVTTTPSGYGLIAWVVGGRTCVVVQQPGKPRPATLTDGFGEGGPAVARPNGHCETTPVYSQLHVESFWSDAVTGSTSVIFGVGGPSVAAVQARLRGTAQATAATATAPLPGPAAQLRFWALEQAADAAQPDELAVLDGSGSVRAAIAPDRLEGGWSVFAGDRDDSNGLPNQLLRRGRVGRTTWELRRTSEQRLAPTPLRPERRVEVRCVVMTLSIPGDSIADPTTGPCDDDLRTTPLAVQAYARCTVGLGLSVVARAPVRSAVAVLGDGRRVKLPLSAMGGAVGAAAGGTFLPSGIAVRRVDALDASGKLVRAWPIGTPPVPASGCSSSSSSVSGFDDAGGEPPKLGAAPHAVHAVDRGEELCLAVDRAPRQPADCDVPPTDPESVHPGAVTVSGGQYFYAIVPVEVTAARVTFTDGTTQTVPATPIPGYAGQYAATTAQIASDIASPRIARTAVLLDAGGRVLGPSRTIGPFGADFGRATTLVPAADGLPALRVTPVRLTLGSEVVRSACVGFSALTTLFGRCDLSLLDSTSSDAELVEITARCTPRRLIVLAALRHSTDGLIVRLKGGGQVEARRHRLPASAGNAAGRSVAMAVLGPRQAIAGLRIRGKADRALPGSYPAAAEQCGYSDTAAGPFS